MFLLPMLSGMKYATKGNTCYEGWYALHDFLSGRGTGTVLDADHTGAAMGAFLSLWFWPLAIMWNPCNNFLDLKVNKHHFWHQLLFQMTFLLHAAFSEAGYAMGIVKLIIYYVNMYAGMVFCYLSYKNISDTLPVIACILGWINLVSGVFLVVVSIVIKVGSWSPPFPINWFFFYANVLYCTSIIYSAPLYQYCNTAPCDTEDGFDDKIR